MADRDISAARIPVSLHIKGQHFIQGIFSLRFPVSVSSLFAVVLWAAAAMKFEGHHLRSEVSHSPSDSLLLPLALMEFLLGAWLLSGLAKRWARTMAVMVLLLFIGALWWQVLNGAKDCGCFGNVLRARPVQTMGFDLVFLALFAFAPRRPLYREGSVLSSGWLRVGGTSALVLMIACTEYLVFRAPQRAAWLPNTQFSDLGDWKGKRLPLISELNKPTAHELSTGRCVLLLIAHHCEKCDIFVNRWISDNQCTFANKVIIIETTPEDLGVGDLASLDIRFTSLQQRVPYLIPTPSVIRVNKGIVEFTDSEFANN